MPAATARDGAETSEADDGRTVDSLRVLVIDDEPRVLELLPPILAGHSVETATGGGAGLERVRDGGFDVVLSDWVMADASGLEIAAAVKERDPDTVFVLMTGWEFSGSQAGSEAVDLRLSKPFEREDVERVMEEAVRLWRDRAMVQS